LDQYRSQWPAARIVADYTGGTKSMSGALLMAAFQRDIEAQVTTGRRENLVRVTSGTETARYVDTRLINIERDFATALRVASHGDYAAAAELINDIRKQVQRQQLTPSKAFNTRLEHAGGWARCLSAWDRFTHRDAWEIYRRAWEEGRTWASALAASGHAPILEDLARGKSEPRLSLCQDLLENARRRERQGRSDDAVARLYRFTEACVQTQLYRRYGLKSGELRASDLPPALLRELQPRGDPPMYQAALRQTAELLRRKDPKDPLAKAYFSGEEHGPPWLSKRNKSILAHGYTSIDSQVVKQAFVWIEAEVLPAMQMTRMPEFPDKPLLG
jgi:CRISPR-associated protein (TIGR02710 family)